MAKKEDRKRQKRRLKEKRKAEKRAARSRFPTLVIIPDGEDPGFMRVVEELLKSFDFDDPAICTRNDRSVYQILRTLGFDGLINWCESSSAQQYAISQGLTLDQVKHGLLSPLVSHLGEWIFERLPDQYRANPLPFHFYNIVPQGRTLTVTFRFLPHVSSQHGTIYFSPFEPRVPTNDGELRVGYTRHSLERACQRLAANRSITYRDFQRVAMHFRHCEFFEKISLQDGQAALRLIAPCTFNEIYLRDIGGFDDETIASGKHFFVLGYCPIQIVHDYAVATTFLFPGYRGTPEDALVNSTRMPAKERVALRAMARGTTLADVADGHQTEALRWYHKNGVPQVITLQRDIYRFR